MFNYNNHTQYSILKNNSQDSITISVPKSWHLHRYMTTKDANKEAVLLFLGNDPQEPVSKVRKLGWERYEKSKI